MCSRGLKSCNSATVSLLRFALGILTASVPVSATSRHPSNAAFGIILHRSTNHIIKNGKKMGAFHRGSLEYRLGDLGIGRRQRRVHQSQLGSQRNVNKSDIKKYERYVSDEDELSVPVFDEEHDEREDKIPWMMDNNQMECDTTTSNEVINGTSQGFIVTKFYNVPLEGFRDGDEKFPSLSDLFTPDNLHRLQLEAKNVTLPAALMLLDQSTYPTQSRARKSIRQRSICICRYQNTSFSNSSDLLFKETGKVITRVYPGDIVGFQRRAGSDYYAVQGVPFREPPFQVPVVYEDDHMAIVNKPPGIVIYRAEGGRGSGARGGGHGRDTLLSALPYVLKPPNFSNGWSYEAQNENKDGDAPQNVALKRPQPVHRLDKPSSGLLVVAKTKSAAVHLAQQFEVRKAEKAYMAIVSGNPQLQNTVAGSIGEEPSSSQWHTIDYDLEGKSAITDLRVIQKVGSLHGQDGQLTLVELKPKTGRYHQLRRHMAWVCKSPLVGDSLYSGADEGALRLRKRGLFLCSFEITVEHPYYNTPSGQKEWMAVKNDNKFSRDAVLQEDEGTGKIVVHAKIKLPEKFETFLEHENTRASKFLN